MIVTTGTGIRLDHGELMRIVRAPDYRTSEPKRIPKKRPSIRDSPVGHSHFDLYRAQSLAPLISVESTAKLPAFPITIASRNRTLTVKRIRMACVTPPSRNGNPSTQNSASTRRKTPTGNRLSCGICGIRQG